MKVLFIGGTGNISASSSRLAVQKGIDLYLLNRGKRKVEVKGAKTISGDISRPAELAKSLAGHKWDAVVNWIAFTPPDIQRDIDLFKGSCSQYIFISSASAYQKPPSHPVITESTPLCNPYWEYSRNKIACEDALNQAYRNSGFPITIVRPSLTYDTVIPMAFCSWNDYTMIDRLRKGQKVIVHGDGTNLWTITHSDDFARGFVGLLGHQQAIGQAFHITSDELLTWNQIWQALGEAVGAAPNIVHIPSDFLCRVQPELTGTLLGDKANSTIFDNTKIKTFVPEFKAVIPFKAGIRRAVEWFDQDKERMQILPACNDTLNRILAAWEKAGA
ncbi:MAG: SDR family oxidoreductase [Planctomycetes bacterium]|nr:SDR family oxidoreductase [Planctomycetota bacterium]